tara:strand:- start:1693 stop:2712 length:1020 start_codon:yes stop_codon:yes gene_type:complete
MKIMSLNNKSILITGGTGSFGKHFTSYILKKYPKIRRLVIFSRDELKQFEMSQFFNEKKYPNIRFFLGDVRDKTRLVSAFNNIDVVIHAAALKQVPAAEYNPNEFVKTNILGAQNIIDCALSTNVKKVVALSTDKAAAPINLYGATKLCSDKLFTSSNNITGTNKIIFSVVRYGNVFGSRGSVVPFFLKQFKNKKKLTITHKEMTRFNISLDDGVKMVDWAIKNMQGGEIFVPKIPSFKIINLAKVIDKKNAFNIIGIREGEKLHEEMITISDSYNTIDLGRYYAILNPSLKKILKFYSNYKKYPLGKSYNSKDNSKYLNNLDLKKLVKKYLITTNKSL